MKKLIKKYSPPGHDLFTERVILISGIILSLFLTVAQFATSFSYELDHAKKSLGVVTIPYFSETADITGIKICFAVLSAIMMCFIIYRYVYLIKTKSIYLTKRLPVWCATEKLCIIVPVCYTLFCIIIWKLTLIIMFIFYYALTPEIYLKQDILFDFIMESLL